MDERDQDHIQIELSDKDREMLERQVKSIEERAKSSANRREQKTDPVEWTFETHPVHHRESKGSPSSVKRGDRADMTSRGSRHDSHPIGNEKIPLK